MSVDLPAPFSPRSAWISPDSTLKLIESFAVKSPNRLVMPRSSRDIAQIYSDNLLYTKQTGLVNNH